VTTGARQDLRDGLGVVSATATWRELDAWQRAQTGALRTVVVPTDARSLSGAPAADEVRSRVLGWFERPDLVSLAVMHGPIGEDQLAVALACDLRIAVDDVRIKIAPLVLPGFIDRLVATVGYAAAAPVLLAAQELTADSAVAIGLADRAVSPSSVKAIVDALVAGVFASDRAVTTEIKASMLRAARIDAGRRALFAADAEARDRLADANFAAFGCTG
jgi:enoyl-CoA hydratase/carnithine racemase